MTGTFRPLCVPVSGAAPALHPVRAGAAPDRRGGSRVQLRRRSRRDHRPAVPLFPDAGAGAGRVAAVAVGRLWAAGISGFAAGAFPYPHPGSGCAVFSLYTFHFCNQAAYLVKAAILPYFRAEPLDAVIAQPDAARSVSLDAVAVRIDAYLWPVASQKTLGAYTNGATKTGG